MSKHEALFDKAFFSFECSCNVTSVTPAVANGSPTQNDSFLELFFSFPRPSLTLFAHMKKKRQKPARIRVLRFFRASSYEKSATAFKNMTRVWVRAFFFFRLNLATASCRARAKLCPSVPQAAVSPSIRLLREKKAAVRSSQETSIVSSSMCCGSLEKKETALSN